MIKKQKRTLVGTLDHPPEPKYKPKVPCGAQTRAGHPCTRPALPGKTRCKLHGGKSTGPKTPFNQNAARTRLYSKIFFAEEEEWIEVARADNDGMSLYTELDVARVQYLRAAVAQKKWLAYRHELDTTTNEMIDGEMRRLGVFERYEIHHKSGVRAVEGSDGAGDTIPYHDLKVVKRQADYSYELDRFGKLVDRFLGRELEMRKAAGTGEDVAQLAEDLEQFYTNAAAMMPGGGPDGAEEEANG